MKLQLAELIKELKEVELCLDAENDKLYELNKTAVNIHSNRANLEAKKARIVADLLSPNLEVYE